MGVVLDHYTIDVETAYDQRGKAMLGDFYVGQMWFKYWLNAQSAEPPARIVSLLDDVERQCRSIDTLRRPVSLVPHVIVNGEELALSLPALPRPETIRAS